MSALTVSESSVLATCEAVIARGVQTFVEVGAALVTIRDGRLYRATHATFADYCRDRWQIGRSRAYQLIDQAEVSGLLAEAAGLSTAVDIHEREARDIKPSLPEVMESVREKVAAGAPPAEAVREAVTEAREAQRPTCHGVNAATETRCSLPLGHPGECDCGGGEDPATGLEEDDDRPAGPALVTEDDGPTVADLLEEQEREIARLESLVESLSASDVGAELVRWKQRYAQLEGRLRQEMTTSREAVRQAEYQAGVLKRIRAELGITQTQQIIPAIRELRRAA